ncbi:MAG: ATP-grasp fold amidoligase family protein [Vicinamibacterales bacterium]
MNSIALTSPLPLALPAPSWARFRVALTYRWRHGRWPNLEAPRRFTEWVQWRKLNDRRLTLALLTDKALSKQIAEARLGKERTIPTLWLGKDLPEIAPWPMPFIVKANHGCGQFVVVKNEADYTQAKATAPQWLGKAYGGWLDEWHYGAARRLVLVEPYIGGAELPMDYKVYVFGGRAKLIQLHSGRERNHRWTQFDRDWRPLSRNPIDANAPTLLAEMLAAAEAMAENEAFLRVDFYCQGGALKFGEYCLYPGSGLDPFTPDTLDLVLGECWGEAQSG